MILREEHRIDVRRSERGVEYRLPSENSPKSRLVGGAFMTVFGLIFGGVAVFMLVGALEGVREEGLSWQSLLMAVPFTLFLLPFLAVGLATLLIGQFLWWGRASVLVGRETIEWRAGIGPLHFRRRRQRRNLRRAAIARMKSRLRGRSPTPSAGEVPYELVLHFEGEKELSIGSGLPLESLRSLATAMELGRRVEFDGSAPGPATVPTPSHDSAPAATLSDLPEGSDVQLEEYGDGFLIRFPARGFFKGGMGFGCFSIVWLTFVTVFAVVFGTVLVRGDAASNVQNPWIAVAILALFFAIGIGMFLAAFTRGRRRTEIEVSRGDLAVRVRGTFGDDSHDWPAGSVEFLGVVGTGVRVNDVPVMCLEVRGEGEKTRLLSERRRDELDWLAGCLGTAVGPGRG